MANEPGPSSPHVLRILISKKREITAEATGLPAVAAVIVIAVLITIMAVRF